MPNSIPMSRVYILTVCIRVSSSFSFFAKSLMSSMYVKRLTFSCDLLYPAVHFLSMWFSGIMAIMNSKGDRASPWKIPLWIFASANLLPPALSSYSLRVFTSALPDCLSLEFVWQQVSSSLLSILTDLNNVVVWVVSTHPLISKSFSPFINPLVNVPRAPITIGIIVTFMFHDFFNSQAKSRYLSFFWLSFSFTPRSTGTAKSTILQVLSFFVVDYHKVWSSGRD